MLNRRLESKHFVFLPNVGGENFSILPFSMILAVGWFFFILFCLLFVDSFYWIEEVPFSSWIIERFLIVNGLGFVK